MARKYNEYEDDEYKKTRWTTVHTEFYNDFRAMPVGVKLNKGEVDGQTRYGIEVRYTDRYFWFNVYDIDKLILGLSKLKDILDSMYIPYHRVDPNERENMRKLIMEEIERLVKEINEKG